MGNSGEAQRKAVLDAEDALLTGTLSPQVRSLVVARDQPIQLPGWEAALPMRVLEVRGDGAPAVLVHGFMCASGVYQS